MAKGMYPFWPPVSRSQIVAASKLPTTNFNELSDEQADIEIRHQKIYSLYDKLNSDVE